VRCLRFALVLYESDEPTILTDGGPFRWAWADWYFQVCMGLFLGMTHHLGCSADLKTIVGWAYSHGRFV
jgi:hypothetical protein